MSETVDIKSLNEKVKQQSLAIKGLLNEVSKVIVGQSYIIERMLVGLLSDGHILLEGVPGLAKTLAVNTMAKAVSGDFKRIQFTPDLLPSDLTGTLIYDSKQGNFNVKKGPVFANFILADEINRAPAKVQSAFLEAMQERQVTIGDVTYPLPDPFLVLATQNPIEQEGTYPLAEAQVDRFMLKLKLDYPTEQEERTILDRYSTRKKIEINSVITLHDLEEAKKAVDDIYVDEKVKNYIVDIVFATRKPEKYNLKELKNLIAFGASPRATINLNLAGKALAFLNGRGFVTPEDIKDIGPDVLRHRILTTYDADAQELTSDDIIKQIFDGVEVP
ncbi:MAG: MoxR family ATPase [Endomicrobiia bacterium]|nr:MoxR family ATPase [Endomicrobiaceae bacterium]MDD3052910.1 MoxR family ATPase [Endomicrobiaceae bacterium]MDD3922132.1 MoxR family ATPase [Endomicrobiaceae bacterium]MDD5102135.1 MoxR family ATPase [Endomicrobiaceae bacterium]